MKDPIIHLAISRSQNHELLAQSNTVNPSAKLREARAILARSVREPKAANDLPPKRITA